MPLEVGSDRPHILAVSGAVVSTVTLDLESSGSGYWPGTFCMESVCSLHVCLGFLPQSEDTLG